MAYVFGADDIRSALGLTATDWEVQDSGDNESGTTAVVRTNKGAYVAATDIRHDVTNELTVSFKCKVAATGAVSFTLGGPGTDDVVLTRVVVRQLHNDFAVVTATAHAHGDGDGHIDVSELKQSVSLTTLGFGVLVNKLGGTLADCQSAEFTFSMDHVEVLDNEGNHATGASYGFKVDAVEEYVTDSPPSPTGAWKEDGYDKKTSNTGYETIAVRAHAYSWS